MSDLAPRYLVALDANEASFHMSAVFAELSHGTRQYDGFPYGTKLTMTYITINLVFDVNFDVWVMYVYHVVDKKKYRFASGHLFQVRDYFINEVLPLIHEGDLSDPN